MLQTNVENSKSTIFDCGHEQANIAVTPNNKIARKWKRKIKNRRERKGTAIKDSVATSSFWREEDEHIKTGIPSNKRVGMPTGQTSNTTEKALLPNKKLNNKARELDLLPELKENSLLSVCKLSDAGYTTIFHPGDGGVTVHWHDNVFIRVSKEAVLQGWRDKSGLWRVPIKEKVGNQNTDTPLLQRPATNKAVFIAHDLPSTEKMIRYLHAALGFPTKWTMLRAIKKGWLVGWPGLTVENVNKWFPESDETQAGHMKQQRQGVRSTQNEEEQEKQEDSPEPRKKHKDVYIKIWDTKEKMFTDQTGKFPYQSVDGHRYLMVLVEIDSNYIDVEPMKSKESKEMVKTYQELLRRIKLTGVCDPKMHVLDNEASKEYQEAIQKQCKMQLVPPDTHRRNIAERARQTFKNHYIAILAGLDPQFPIFLWSKLLPQTVLTLNLVRPSNVAPNVSAYAYMHGQFDFNVTPLAPLGCPVQLYLKPHRRKSWAKHAADGWYLGVSLKHYRCHRVWNKETQAERISDTVFFKHKYITQPTLTPEDLLLKAIQDLRHVLQKAKNTKGELEYEAIEKLDEIFNSQKADASAPRVETADPRVEASALANANTHPNLRAAQQKTIEATAPRLNAPAPKNTGPAGNTRAAARRRAVEHCAQILHSELSSRIVNPKTKVSTKGLQELVHAVMDMETGQMLNYRDLLKHPVLGKDWQLSAANEFGRLAKGVGGRIEGTNTIKFIAKESIPAERRKDITYAGFVCKVRSEKTKEPNRTRCVAGGNLINYPWDVGTATAEMLLVKIFFNSIISTRGARFMTIDISNFYLGTPMKRKLYMRIKLISIPQKIIKEYKLNELATADGWVYVKIGQGVYGLPQIGIIAQEQLAERLDKHGYKQSKILPGLWTHISPPIFFTLVVDDFGVKYTNKKDAEHLLEVLQEDYQVKPDWERRRYIGIKLD